MGLVAKSLRRGEYPVDDSSDGGLSGGAVPGPPELSFSVDRQSATGTRLRLQAGVGIPPKDL